MRSPPGLRAKPDRRRGHRTARQKSRERFLNGHRPARRARPTTGRVTRRRRPSTPRPNWQPPLNPGAGEGGGCISARFAHICTTHPQPRHPHSSHTAARSSAAASLEPNVHHHVRSQPPTPPHQDRSNRSHRMNTRTRSQRGGRTYDLPAASLASAALRPCARGTACPPFPLGTPGNCAPCLVPPVPSSDGAPAAHPRVASCGA